MNNQFPANIPPLLPAHPPQPSSMKGSAAIFRVLVIIAVCARLVEGLLSTGRQYSDRREQAAQITQANIQVQGEVRQMLKATNQTAALAALHDVSQTYDRAADGSSGRAKAVLQALSRFCQKSASVMANLPGANRLITQGMDMTDVETLDQCHAKKMLVLQGCDMIDEVAAYEMKIQENMRNELQLAQLPSELIAKMLAADQEDANLVRQDSSALLSYSQSRKKMANLLEFGWGKWTFMKDKKAFAFTDATISADYQAALKACQSAVAAQKAVDKAERQEAKRNLN